MLILQHWKKTKHLHTGPDPFPLTHEQCHVLTSLGGFFPQYPLTHYQEQFIGIPDQDVLFITACLHIFFLTDSVVPFCCV